MTDYIFRRRGKEANLAAIKPIAGRVMKAVTPSIDNAWNAAKRFAGRHEDVAQPLFGKDIAQRARQYGSSNATWAPGLDRYGRLDYAKRGIKNELNEDGWGGHAMFNLNSRSAHGVHNLNGFKGVIADSTGGLRTYSPALAKGIESRGGTVIGQPLNAQAKAQLSDKLGESQVLQQIGGAKASGIADALKAIGVDPNTTRISTAQAEQLLNHLRSAYGGKFIVKPQISNASRAETLITETSTPAQARRALNLGVKNLFGDTIGAEGPARWMAQERLDIEKAPWIDRVLTGIDERQAAGTAPESWWSMLSGSRVPGGNSSMNREARVHAIGGKVIPYGSNWRGTSSSNWADFAHRRHLRAAERAAQEAIDKMPEHLRNGAYGFDMVKAKGRGWVPLEMNPTHDGASGFMTLGSHADEATRAAIEGRLPQSELDYRKMRSHILGNAAAAAGGAGTLGYVAYDRHANSPEAQQPKAQEPTNYDNGSAYDVYRSLTGR